MTELAGSPETEQPTTQLADEIHSLLRAVRRMVRAENVHLRGIQAAGGDWNEAQTSRDGIDLALADLYAEWPANRLDRILATLPRTEQAPLLPVEAGELIERAVAEERERCAKIAEDQGDHAPIAVRDMEPGQAWEVGFSDASLSVAAAIRTLSRPVATPPVDDPKDLVEALERLAAKATPGKWSIDPAVGADLVQGNYGLVSQTMNVARYVDDAALIVALQSNLPTILSALRALASHGSPTEGVEALSRAARQFDEDLTNPRGTAVEIVDGIRGYTIEFDNLGDHAYWYDRVEALASRAALASHGSPTGCSMCGEMRERWATALEHIAAEADTLTAARLVQQAVEIRTSESGEPHQRDDRAQETGA